jgi:hypothetical protein
MTTFNDIKRRAARLQMTMGQQLKALKDGTRRGYPRIPIGPGPILRALKAVRVLRRNTNKSFVQLEGALMRALADARKRGRAGTRRSR